VDKDCDGAMDEGIEELKFNPEEWTLDVTLPMYNILGQRVDETYRGIIIQKGHKFLIY
jgi:hypothetical protein